MPLFSFLNRKPIEVTFNQSKVLSNMEFYLRKKGRNGLAEEIKNNGGYCHGFSLYFLQCAAKGKMEDYFNNLHQIASWDGKEDRETIFEKVIAHIVWLQDPKPYIPTETQSSIEVLFEGEFQRDASYYDNFSTLESFVQFLKEHVPDGRPILLESSNHATAIFKDENGYFCYDPNDLYGLRKFNRIEEVAAFYFEELTKNYPKVEGTGLPITLNVYKTNQQNSCGLESYADYVTQKLVSDPEFIHRKGPDGTTALWQAVTDGNLNAVKMLLDLDADPNVFEPTTKVSAFEFAFDLKRTDISDLLLTHSKFDPNFADIHGNTPLILAAKYGSTKPFNQLIKKDINVNCMTKSGETALQIAVNKNNIDWVSKLSSKGANILLKKEDDKSPLEIVLEKCLDSKKTKQEKVNDIAMLETLLTQSSNTPEVREACFELLNKNKNLMSEQNPEVAFLLMDKHTSSDLALCIDQFLLVPKIDNKTSWFSIYNKRPVENDEVFEKMLQRKIGDSSLDVNSPAVLKGMIIEVMKECAERKLHFSEDFKVQLSFTTKYLQHREMVEQFQPKLAF